MEILYKSTRSENETVTASQAILKGLASDGGLFVPTQLPKLNVSLEELSKMSYKETAYAVMKEFLTDFTEEELKSCIDKAYDSKFDTEEIAPLVKAEGAYYLELFHGATIAFKDMALSILPHLLTTSAKKNNVKNEIVILTATSGDTGKAALAGFADVPGTRIVVFYPKGGVSPIQEKQMVTQKGDNTFVVGIKGNFDQAQSGVKAIFGNKELEAEMDKAGFQFSSANSINIGRLVPQVVYYVYAYAKLLANGEITDGEKINVVVPTGNFGNILAAYYAKNMGLPIDKLICASNDNKVLYDFFTTGTYDKNREFILTTSPSMDILISSDTNKYTSDVWNGLTTDEKIAAINKLGMYGDSTNSRIIDLIEMPKFELDYTVPNFKSVLEANGMKTAFDVNNASFKKIGDKIYVDSVIHKAKIKVDENGTEAAAATAVIIKAVSAIIKPAEKIEFIADRPFIFCIRDTVSGTILFIGEVNDL